MRLRRRCSVSNRCSRCLAPRRRRSAVRPSTASSRKRTREPGREAALIDAAQAAEHYEIARYGSLIAWAKQLGRNDCASVLQKTLEEEKATDKKLTTLAESKINLRAAS